MVILTAGTFGNVIRLLPPLVISDELLIEGLDVLADGAGRGALRVSQVKPFWVAGKPARGPAVHEVRSPFDGHMVDRHALPTPEDVDEAVAAAVDVQPQALATTAAQRADAPDARLAADRGPG